MPSSEQQHGIVGSCEDCDGQMVEVSKFTHDGTGTLTLKCQGCGAKGKIDYAVGEEQPWKNPSVQEGVVDTTVKQIHWIDCARCDGHGMIEDPLCDLRRAMNGREHPCPVCDFTGKIPRVVETDGSGTPPVRDWILEQLDERTEADPDSDQGVQGDIWTSKGRLVKHAGKFSTPVQKAPVEAELSELINDREVLYWHGHLTLATVPYLNAVVQSEQQAEVTRQILIDKCRRWLTAKAEGGDDDD